MLRRLAPFYPPRLACAPGDGQRHPVPRPSLGGAPGLQSFLVRERECFTERFPGRGAPSRLFVANEKIGPLLCNPCAAQRILSSSGEPFGLMTDMEPFDAPKTGRAGALRAFRRADASLAASPGVCARSSWSHSLLNCPNCLSRESGGLRRPIRHMIFTHATLLATVLR